MKIAVLGAGWYGCHIAKHLLTLGYEVKVYEVRESVFAGASGNNPARLHLGWHYPRSRLTRAACQEHVAEFMTEYGRFTRAIPTNVYAVAAHDSLVDAGTYWQTMSAELDGVPMDPAALGLENVEAAYLTNERHILVANASAFFRERLAEHLVTGVEARAFGDPTPKKFGADALVDCTFCANDEVNIDRFEPCLTFWLQGPTDRAVTIMDGAFPSIYPRDPWTGTSSLTSASLTPLSKTCRTYAEAAAVLAGLPADDAWKRGWEMMMQMERFWPGARDSYRIIGYGAAIRAMPRSGADARLVDVIEVGYRHYRVRAGKIDAIFHAARMVADLVRQGEAF